MIVDLYIPRASWLHAADPRVKLLFVVCVVALLLVFKNAFFMLGVVVLLNGLHLAAGVPRDRLAFAWRAVLPVSLIMAVLWVLFNPEGEIIAQVWVIRLTPLNLAQGAALALRIIAMSLAVLLWLYTTEQTAIVRSLVKLGLPFVWGLALALALRYIPAFYAAYRLITEAQQARALDLAAAKGFQRVRAMLPILVALIISSLRASDQMARALESRALGAEGVRRTYLHELALRPADYVLAVLLSLATAGLLYANLAYGLGAHPLNLL